MILDTCGSVGRIAQLNRTTSSGDKDSALTKTALYALVKEQGFKCALTGRDLTPECASLDYRLPISKGGDNSMANVWVVHSIVNRAKGDMTEQEFIAMCLEVVATMRPNALGKAGSS